MTAGSSRPTVLLLPGLMCDASMWGHQIATLESAGYRVVVPDFRGLDSLPAMARLALASAEGPLAIVGHSMGGRAAIEAWALEPQRIARLALLDTAAHPPRPGERDSRLPLIAAGHTQGMEAVSAMWLPPMVAPHRRDDAALIEPLHAMILRSTPAQFEGQQTAILNRRDLRPVLASMTVPVDFAVGRHDAHSPVSQHEDMAALTPGARLTVFEDSGHMAPAEAPEEVSRFLLDWLER